MLENVSRRSFIQGAAVAGAGIAAAAASGARAAHAEEATSAAADAPAAGGSYTPGSYTGTTQGNGGQVTVTVEVDETSILSVVAEGPNETAGIGSIALEEVPPRIVEANSVEVDGTAGATVTSDAIKRAVSAALRQASGEEAGTKVVQDGRYVTRALGMLSYVRVSTTFKDGKIADVQVISSDETRHLSDAAENTIPGLIVENQSVSIDAVTGATVTSNAILSAVRQAITNAGGDPIDFEIPVPPKEVEKTEVAEDVDVAIVGAGLAGLTAGYNLAKAGKIVHVYEKLPLLWCQLPVLGWYGLHGRHHRSQGIR